MTKLITLVLSLTIPFIACSQHNLIIKGKAPLIKDGTKIMVQRMMPRRFSDRKPKIDSAVVENHRFEFELKNNNGEFYTISIGKYSARLYLQPGKADITIADSLLTNVVITDNLMADENKQFQNQVLNDSVNLGYRKVSNDYYNYSRNNKPNVDTLAAKEKKRDEFAELYNKQYVRLVLNWIQIHPNSYLNTYLLYTAYNLQEQLFSEAQIRRVFYAMPVNITNNVWGRELKYRIDSLLVGSKAPDFAQGDINGKVVKLSDFKGKYVLVDFWASWCVPCREESPSIVKASEQFSTRNFTVLGISLDKEKAPWLRAIEQDGLHWIHLSDLGYWRNSVSVKYYVYEIPANYLIDPSGTIIAKNLHGDELESTLKKLIK